MKEKKIEMDELHTWYEVPAISHYFHVFKESFDLIDFEIEDFEESLLIDGTENFSSFIPDLVVCLLRGLYKTRDGLQITLENYNQYLKDLLDFHYKTKQNKENPVTDKDFKFLSARSKVEVLSSMCNWRLELEDVMELTKNIDPDHMRVDPVGTDCEGSTYWYFYGTRLYKEKKNVNVESEKPEISVNHTRTAQTKSGRPIRKKARIDTITPATNCKSKQPFEKSIDNASISSAKKVWSLHCSTLQDWDDFLTDLQGKKNKKEKELLSAIEVLDISIKKLFKEKEASYHRKMLMMAPRRSSDRITMKMKLKEEEEKVQEEERLLKSLQKAKELEEKQKQQQEERLKERIRRTLEREKLLEERALRVKQREEQKLNIDSPELLHSTKKSSSLIKVLYSDDSDSEHNDKFFSMEKVLHTLLDHNDSWPFEEPVKEEEAPKYYTYIKHPMDFKTIEEKIRKKVYKQKSEFESDVLLVFDNCEMYNGTASPFTKMAMKLKKVFTKQMKKEFPPELDEDDDYFFMSDEQPVKAKRMKMQKSNNSISSSVQEQIKVLTPVAVGSSISSDIAPVKTQTGSKTIKQASSSQGAYTIPSEALEKMSPAQLQLLMLRSNPRAAFSRVYLDGKQNNMQNGQNVVAKPMQQETAVVNQQSISLNQKNDSILSNPLHQLADTALAPLQISSKVVLTNNLLRSNSLPYNLAPLRHQINDLKPRSGIDSMTVRGRPRKPLSVTTTIIQDKNSVSFQCQQLDANVLASKLHPATISWDDLKRQLMSQMKNAGANIPADSPRWEQVKEQIMTQMNGLGANVPKVVFTHATTQLTKAGSVISNATTTLSGQMFSFSNVLKSKEVIASAVTSIERTTFPILTKIDHVALPSHSKVESWLNSTREFIGKDSESATSSPQSFHTSLPLMTSMSNTVRLLPDTLGFLKNAGLSSAEVLRTHIDTQPLSASVEGSLLHPNNDLQKAAQQVAAVNQISSKLHAHLSKSVDLKYTTSAVALRELRVSSSPSFTQTSNGLDTKKQFTLVSSAVSNIKVWDPQQQSAISVENLQNHEKKLGSTSIKLTKSLPILFRPVGYQFSPISSTLVRPEVLSNISIVNTVGQPVVSNSTSASSSSYLNTSILESKTSNAMSVIRNSGLPQTQESNNSRHIFINSSQKYIPQSNGSHVLIVRPTSNQMGSSKIESTKLSQSPQNQQIILRPQNFSQEPVAQIIKISNCFPKIAPTSGNHSLLPQVSSNVVNGSTENKNSLEKQSFKHTPESSSQSKNTSSATYSTNLGGRVVSSPQAVPLSAVTSSAVDSQYRLIGVSQPDNSTEKSFIAMTPT